MDNRFDIIESKIDKLSDKLDVKMDTVNTKLSDYNIQLIRHIEGTEQNREDIKKIYSEMEVVVMHVNFMQNIKKFLLEFVKVTGILGTILGAVMAILKYLKGM